MERAVKERLVGAAVLMAAAIILIPEMLSGPDRETVPNEPAAAGDAPIKTYTIDLNQAPGAPPLAGSSAGAEETRAPPPEESVLPEPLPTPAEPSVQGMPESESPPPVVANDAAQTRAPAPAASTSEPVMEPPTPATRQAPAPLASTPAAPTSDGWAVQLISYAQSAKAERLARELSGQGYQAFVMPVKSGSGTLYRVRIGPMKDRASAEATLRKVKSTQPDARIVPHP